jgi:hypothetical protein
MQFIVIKGNVKGGHQIIDLGLNIAFGEEVSIPLQRAGWSRDLMFSIKNNSVVKIGQREHRPAPLPPQARKPPVAAPVRVKKAPKKPLPPRLPPSPPASQEVEDLKAMNRALMETLADLTSSQRELVSKIDGMVTQGPLQAPTRAGRPRPAHDPSQPDREREADDWDEEEPVIFLPSKIRSDTTVVSESTSVQEETKDASDKMDAASEALASIGKGGSKKRRPRKKKEE